MAIHSFEARFAAVDRPEVAQRVDEILRRDIEAVRIERASVADDMRGVDFWAYLTGKNRQGVDVKLRRTDWHDIYVELISRSPENVPGWSVDRKKITDYVLFLWPKRHLLLPYPQLRATVRRNEVAYRERYGTMWAKSKSATSSWSTENCPLPDGALFMDMFGISVPGLPLTKPRKCPSCNQDHPAGTTCAGGWAPWPE